MLVACLGTLVLVDGLLYLVVWFGLVWFGLDWVGWSVGRSVGRLIGRVVSCLVSVVMAVVTQETQAGSNTAAQQVRGCTE